jgi:hypothetical protein
MGRCSFESRGAICTLGCVWLFAWTTLAASAEVEPYPKPPQRPEVVTPACKEPKPYYIDGWVRGAVGFEVMFETNVADIAGEADRLARKYQFFIEERYFESGEYSVMVVLLKPEQVAALRCESSVKGIGFMVEVTISSARVVLPNISLQADRER